MRKIVYDFNAKNGNRDVANRGNNQMIGNEAKESREAERSDRLQTWQDLCYRSSIYKVTIYSRFLEILKIKELKRYKFLFLLRERKLPL